MCLKLISSQDLFITPKSPLDVFVKNLLKIVKEENADLISIETFLNEELGRIARTVETQKEKQQSPTYSLLPTYPR